MQFDASVHEHALHRQFRLHLRQLELGILEIRQRLAEHLALRHVFDGPFQRCLRRGDRPDRLHHALLGKFLHQLVEASAFLTQKVGDRHAKVGEKQLGGVLRLAADFFQHAAALKAGAIGFHQDQADPARAGVRVGLAGQHQQVGAEPGGDEHLLAVDDVVIAVAQRGGAHRRHIAAAGWLGHAQRHHDLALRHGRKPAALLRLRPVMHEIGRDDVRMQVEGRAGGAGARHLLDHDGTEQKISSGAAIRFRHAGAKQPKFAGYLPDRARHDPGFLPFRVMGGDFGGDEAANLVAEQLMLAGEQGPGDHAVATVVRRSMLAIYSDFS